MKSDEEQKNTTSDTMLLISQLQYTIAYLHHRIANDMKISRNVAKQINILYSHLTKKGNYTKKRVVKSKFLQFQAQVVPLLKYAVPIQPGITRFLQVTRIWRKLDKETKNFFSNHEDLEFNEESKTE
ncbi:hypothetical protein BDAP_000976 [Binucleata daphniae]